MNRVNSRNDFDHDDSTINIAMAIIIIIIIIIIICCRRAGVRVAANSVPVDGRPPGDDGRLLRRRRRVALRHPCAGRRPPERPQRRLERRQPRRCAAPAAPAPAVAVCVAVAGADDRGSALVQSRPSSTVARRTLRSASRSAVQRPVT